MSKITAIIPTFNEEANIAAAIQSVQFADEIIVVDSFSTDKTAEIVKSFGVKLLQHEYIHSAAQKNWTIPQATHDWIVLLDADEVITPELQNEIIEKVKSDPKEACFWIYRSNDFMGRRIKYTGWQRDKVIRLFRKSMCKYEDKRVHAEIITTGSIGYLRNKILHNTYKGLDHYLEKLNRYTWLQAEDYNEKTGTLTPYHFIIKPWFRLFKHYILERGFLDGMQGFIISVLHCYAVFLRYVKVWMLRKGIR